MLAVKFELMFDDDGLDSFATGGAGAIFTSRDFAPRAVLVVLPVGDVVTWLLTGIIVLLVGEALMVIVFVVTTALVELVTNGDGDGVPEARSSSIIASWMARSSCEFSFRPRASLAGQLVPENPHVMLASSDGCNGATVADSGVQYESDGAGA